MKTRRMLEVPTAERPRERLLDHGARSLSDAELIAVLLRTGRTGASASDLARELLDTCGGLAGLEGAVPIALRRVGLGPAKAASLLAAVEIARRLARERLPSNEPLLARPADVARYLSLRFRERDQEVVGALFLDSRHRWLGEREIFRGTLQRAAVEPREILKEALLRGAAGVVLFHTHPSGDPSPSLEDFAFTRRMVEASGVVGIDFVDHLVLGTEGRWSSIRERRPW